MVDNQHRKIKGYRDLAEDEIEILNKIKEKAAEVGDLIEFIDRGVNGAEINVDNRWLAIGRTELRQGFMALTRAIARPDFF